MASQGPNTVGTGANDASIGTTAWVNPGNILSSNNVYATFSGGGSPLTSNYLKATNFGFSIPSGATIDGIIVEFERKASVNTGLNNLQDSTISLVKGGSVVGSNNAVLGFWPTIEAFYSYGSSSDLWGTTWTDTDINSSNFGVVLSALKTRFGKTNPSGSVDSVRITVHYTAGGGGGPTFNALLLSGD